MKATFKPKCQRLPCSSNKGMTRCLLRMVCSVSVLEYQREKISKMVQPIQCTGRETEAQRRQRTYS